MAVKNQTIRGVSTMSYSLKMLCLFVLSLTLTGLGSAAVCTEYSNSQEAGGNDFFDVTEGSYNQTVMGEDQLFQGYTAFTPRLNFTVLFNTSINFSDGNQPDGSWQLEYYNASNIRVWNGTTLMGGDEANYTYSRVTAAITLVNKSYENNTDLRATYNRTFIKNTEDLVTTYSAICTQCGSMYNYTPATWTWGTDVGVSIRDADLNGHNWAVTWLFTNRTCLDTTNSATTAGLTNVRDLAYAGLALLAVGILVVASFALVQVFQGGNVDLMTVSITVIIGAVVIILAYVILHYVFVGIVG